MTHVNEEQRDYNLDLVDRARRAQLAVNDILSAAGRDAEETKLQLIGIGGHYESGKDAWADELVRTHGYTKTWMSYPLHRWLLQQNPWIRLDQEVWSLEQFHYPAGEFVTYAWLDYHLGYVEMKKQREVRNALQQVGTNCGRKMIDWDVWVDAMKRQIQDWAQAGKSKLIVTGIRYPNELDAIVALGGDTVWVERPEATAAHEARLREDSERVTQGLPPLVHDSDTSLTAQDFSSIIMNDSDLEELKRRAELWHDSRWP